MADFRTEIDGDGLATVAWDAAGRSMNVFTSGAIDELGAAIDRLAADRAVRGVVIASAKPAFSGGADLAMFEAMHRAYRSAREHDETAAFATLFAGTRRLSRLLRRIETFGKPVVAAVDGLCLGGGFELVLACHCRLVAKTPQLRLGLPEIKVGLFPGAGGTQRLPRLVGLAPALSCMLDGRQVGADEIGGWRGFDLVAPDRLLAEAKARLRSGLSGEPALEGALAQAPDASALSAIVADAERRRPDLLRNYPAARAVVDAATDGLRQTLAEGLRIESRLFAEIVGGRTAGAMMRTLFLNPQALAKSAPSPPARTALDRVGLDGGDEVEPIGRVLRRAGVEVLRQGDAAFAASPLVLLGASASPTPNHPAQAFALLGRCDPAVPLALHFGTRAETSAILEIAPSAAAGDVSLGVALARKLRRTPILIAAGHGFLCRTIAAALARERQAMRSEGFGPRAIGAAAARAGWPGDQAAGTDEQAEALAFRLLARPALAAAAAFLDGVVGEARAVDVCAVLGADFPAYTGGPLAFIDGFGIQALLDRLGAADPALAAMAARGARFYPPM